MWQVPCFVYPAVTAYKDLCIANSGGFCLAVCVRLGLYCIATTSRHWKHSVRSVSVICS